MWMKQNEKRERSERNILPGSRSGRPVCLVAGGGNLTVMISVCLL